MYTEWFLSVSTELNNVFIYFKISIHTLIIKVCNEVMTIDIRLTKKKVRLELSLLLSLSLCNGNSQALPIEASQSQHGANNNDIKFS